MHAGVHDGSFVFVRDQHFRHVGRRLNLSVGYRRDSHSLEGDLPPVQPCCTGKMRHQFRRALLRAARVGNPLEICNIRT